VTLKGNVSWNPKLHQTHDGKAVCSFGLATNRNWTTETGEQKEETEFHRCVAFGKLGEICNQYLRKGRRVFVEGRIHSHNWTASDGMQKTEYEIYIDEMEILDSKLPAETGHEEPKASETPVQTVTNHQPTKPEATTV
jgi:single-strand DNA-binding protein